MFLKIKKNQSSQMFKSQKTKKMKRKALFVSAIALMGAAGSVFTSCDDKEKETPTVAVTGVTVSPADTTLAVGATFTAKATVQPADATDKEVTWKSSAEAVATVTADGGVVTAKTAGTATITATTKDGGKTATVAVTVTADEEPPTPVAVTGVTISPSDAQTLIVDGTLTLTATVAPDNATNKSVTWSSSDEAVATVVDGVVTAKGAGSATITVTSVADNSKSASVTVTVNAATIAVEGVTLSPSDPQTLAVDGTLTLTATVAPDNATDKAVTWSSSDEAVATVVDGVVTAKGAGSATITVTSVADNSKTASVAVTVSSPAGEEEAEELKTQLGDATRSGTTVTLTGDVSIAEATVAEDVTLVVPASKTFTVTGTLTNNGTLDVAGAVDATAYAGTGIVDLQNDSKSKGLVATPTSAATGWVWKFGNLVWSDQIAMEGCDDEGFKNCDYVSAECARFNNANFYNWYYVDANKETMCATGWHVPTGAELSVIPSAVSRDDLLAAWGAPGRISSYGDRNAIVSDGPYHAIWSTTITSEARDIGCTGEQVTAAGGHPKPVALVNMNGWYNLGDESAAYGYQVRCVKDNDD
jgi:uncharacterized protein YjdB